MKKALPIILVFAALSVQGEVPNYPVSEQVVKVSRDHANRPVVTIPDSIVLNLHELEMIDHIAKFAGLPFFFPEGQLRDKVRISASASIMARMKAEDMVNRGYYSHDDPDGKMIYQYLNQDLPDHGELWGVLNYENITIRKALDASDMNIRHLRNAIAYEGLPSIWADFLIEQLPMSGPKYAFLDFLMSDKGHSEALRGAGRAGYYDQIGVGVAVRNVGNSEYPEEAGEELYIVIIFADKNWNDPRKVYAPDGTDLSGKDAKKLGEGAGIRWASYGAGNKWESSIGKFVDVGGGFLLHDHLGMLYHDMAAVDREFSLTAIRQWDVWLKPNGYQLEYDDATRGISNQGFNLLHSEFGWLWTSPSVYPRLYKRGGGQLEVIKGVGVRDLQTGVVKNFSRETASESFVEMNFGNWQVYQGDPVVLAWNSAKSAVTVQANVNGEVKTSTSGLHAWGWTAEQVGEYPAFIENAKGERVERKLVVIPQPHTANLWIDAEPKVVKVNEPFMVSWNALGDVPAQISGTSYGVFSNVPQGSQLLSRAIAGKYHFTVRMGNHRQTVTVQVVE